jgi:hypothetical protein
MQPLDPTIARTPAPGCPACQAQRRHTVKEWKEHHPLSGTGGEPRAAAAAGGQS